MLELPDTAGALIVEPKAFVIETAASLEMLVPVSHPKSIASHGNCVCKLDTTMLLTCHEHTHKVHFDCVVMIF